MAWITAIGVCSVVVGGGGGGDMAVTWMGLDSMVGGIDRDMMQ